MFNNPNPQLPPWMQNALNQPQRDVFTSQDGSVHSSPYDAIDHALNFEQTGNTGANCPQDPNNLNPGR